MKRGVPFASRSVDGKFSRSVEGGFLFLVPLVRFGAIEWIIPWFRTSENEPSVWGSLFYWLCHRIISYTFFFQLRPLDLVCHIGSCASLEDCILYEKSGTLHILRRWCSGSKYGSIRGNQEVGITSAEVGVCRLCSQSFPGRRSSRFQCEGCEEFLPLNLPCVAIYFCQLEFYGSHKRDTE